MQPDNAEGSSKLVTELTDRQKSVLVGTLLGDGCLAQHGRYHRLHIKHKEAHRALVEFKYSTFEPFVSMEMHEFGQELNGSSFPCVQFATRTSPVFTAWYSRFYREGRKIVPEDIDSYLSPLALAVWLMDDGAADFAGVTLQTHCFALREVESLAKLLNRQFGLVVTTRGNKGGSVLYINAASLDSLRSAVEQHLLPEFEYKLIPRRLRTP